jgi:AraC-like DNA-binding protein
MGWRISQSPPTPRKHAFGNVFYGQPEPRTAAPPVAREGPHGRRLEEDWPVERLANVSGVSEAHFARSFKEAFGVPPHRYLLTRRIERAKALLRDTDAPIIEIALQTGWNSLGTFGRVFRGRHRREPERAPRARAGERPSARPGTALLRQRCLQARPQDRSFGEAAAGCRR